MFEEGSPGNVIKILENKHSHDIDGRYLGIRFDGRKTSADNPGRPLLRLRYTERHHAKRPILQNATCHIPEMRFVRTVLRDCGLDPKEYRSAPLIRRLPACLRAIRKDDVTTALDDIRRDPVQLSAAVNALLIGTTSFFRDPKTFAALRQIVIPGLLKMEKHPRVWSVACSEGAELYSVAMIFDLLGRAKDAHFLGSDCRTAVLDTAKAGEYAAHLADEVPGDIAARCLIRKGSRTAVRPDLVAHMNWELSDILAPRELGTWNLILCRNLAIYLEPSSARRMWKRLAAALAPGGFLVVGKAEKPAPGQLKRIGPCIFQKPFGDTP